MQPTATTAATRSPTLTQTAPAFTASPTLTPPSLPTPTQPVAPTSTEVPATQVPPTPTWTPPPTDTPPPVPTSTPTETPLIGPVVTAFGIADNSGTFNQVVETDGQGRSVFSRQVGNDFVVYVEGRPGQSRLPVGVNLLSTQLDNPIGQPDLQMVSSRSLGNGSVAVCDKAFPNTGGVPAIDPPTFAFEQVVSDALNDLSCRFRVFHEADFACTQDNNGTVFFRNGGSTVQFCTLVNDSLTFPTGDTVLTVRLRDTAGQAGPPAQIVVRVRGQ